MKSKWITHNQNSRLILIFLGWAADAKMLNNVSRDGYDILALWDYRDETAPYDVLGRYSEVCVIAWSFGVMEAARLLNRNRYPHDNLTLCVAINGTTHPVDDRMGIPKDIFKATLDNLDEQNLTKFYRRISRGTMSWDDFQAILPTRPLRPLIDELTILGQRAEEPVPDMPWTMAYIGDRDAIFPERSQRRSWKSANVTTVNLFGIGHLPNWQQLIDRVVVDKPYVAQRFETTRQTYDLAAQLQLRVAEHLWDLTAKFLRHKVWGFNVLEIGCGTGMLTRKFLDAIHPTTLTLWDMGAWSDTIPSKGAKKIEFKQCDAELEIRQQPPGSYDIIISSSTAQWFHSLPEFVRYACRALAPGGILAFSTYGPSMCVELAAANLTTRDYPNRKIINETTIPEDTTLLASEEELIYQRFDSPIDVLYHLRQTGVNALSRKPLKFSDMRHAIDNYPLLPDESAQLTYHPIYYIIQKKK